MFINPLLSTLPTMAMGAAMVYFSDEIANFIKDTGSTSLIRGLDNPWTFKALGWLLIIGSPVYALISWYLMSLPTI